MVSDMFQRGLYSLSHATVPNEAHSAWWLMGETKKDKYAIISLEGYNKNIYSKSLDKLINLVDSPFVPYFESGKLYFLDNELVNEMYKNAPHDVTFPIDYSVMLDTNYSSYIQTFVDSKDWSSMGNDVFNTIDILIREDFNYDYLFYMIENYKNSFCNSNSDNVTSDQERKAGLYQNLVSLELFKNIDKKEYCSKGIVKYNISKQESYMIVDGIFNDMFISSRGKEMMDIFLNIHKAMVLFLIGVLRIRFQSKSNSEYKIRELFEYTNDTLGMYLEREMIVAHKYFIKPTDVPILNRLNKGMNKNKLFKNIENIAWDFTSPRIMEFFLRLRGEGRYLIPLFLTNDRNLRNLLRLYKVKGVIFNKDGTGLIPISSMNSQEYFEEYKCNVNFEEFFNEESTKKRNFKIEFNKLSKFKCIDDEFAKLVNIMECK